MKLPPVSTKFSSHLSLFKPDDTPSPDQAAARRRKGPAPQLSVFNPDAPPQEVVKPRFEAPTEPSNFVQPFTGHEPLPGEQTAKPLIDNEIGLRRLIKQEPDNVAAMVYMSNLLRDKSPDNAELYARGAASYGAPEAVYQLGLLLKDRMNAALLQSPAKYTRERKAKALAVLNMADKAGHPSAKQAIQDLKIGFIDGLMGVQRQAQQYEMLYETQGSFNITAAA